MSGVRSSLGWAFSERYLLLAMSIASSFVLARLLTPTEIGTYSVSLAVIGIAQVVRDFGVGGYLVQEKNLTEDHVRSAFGFTLLIGVFLFVCFLLGAPWIGRFYGNEALTRLIRISSFNFLTLPFCIISLALLRREMQFERLLYANLATSVLRVSTTIGLAWKGFGADSLAIGSVVSNLGLGLATWIARGAPRLLAPGFRQWSSIFGYGKQSTLANVVTGVAMDVNDLVVGKVLGVQPVAIISRAQGIMNLYHLDITGAVRNVLFPAFAAQHREGRNLEEKFVYAVSALTVLGWPFYAFVSIYSVETLRLLFGPQWDEAAPLVPWFCAAGAFSATWSLVLSLLTAVGRIDLASRADLIIQPLRAAILIAVIVTFRSLEAFATAFAIVYALMTPAFYLMKQRAVPNDGKAILRVLAKSAGVTLLAIAPAAAMKFTLLNAGYATAPIPAMVLAGALTLITWLAALHLVRHPVAKDPALQRVASYIPFARSR